MSETKSKYKRQITTIVGIKTIENFDKNGKKIKASRVPVYKRIGKSDAEPRKLKTFEHKGIKFEVLVSEGQRINVKKAFKKLSKN